MYLFKRQHLIKSPTDVGIQIYSTKDIAARMKQVETVDTSTLKSFALTVSVLVAPMNYEDVTVTSDVENIMEAWRTLRGIAKNGLQQTKTVAIEAMENKQSEAVSIDTFANKSPSLKKGFTISQLQKSFSNDYTDPGELKIQLGHHGQNLPELPN